MSSHLVLTKEEKSAISTLKRLAKRWPKSLWLFSGAGTLCVMRMGEDGEPVFVRSGNADSVDQDYVIAKIDIENDGGDW